MLFLKTTTFIQILSTQFLNGIPTYVGDLRLRVWGYKGEATVLSILDDQIIRFTYSSTLKLPINNEQLIIINKTTDDWYITNYSIVDSTGQALFRYAYIPPDYLLLEANQSIYTEVAGLQLDI